MKKEKVSFMVKEQKLVGTLLIPNDVSFPASGVVFYHGRGSSQRGYVSRAEAVARKGTICLTFDFRGCGESEGNFSQLTNNDGLTDALAGYDFLASQKSVDKKRIGICGASFGGYLASIVSSKRGIKSLALRAPAIYKDSWRDISLSKIPVEKIIAFRKDEIQNNVAFQSIRQFAGSLLVIGGEKDETIPSKIVKAYYNNAVSTKERKIVFIKNATHRLTKKEWNQEFIRLIADWFNRTL